MTPAEKPTPPSIESLRRMFKEANDLTVDARRESQTDDDYYHGHQLTPAEKAALKSRRQPDGAFNRIRPAIEGMLGVLKQGETDPRAYPRNPQDEDSADVASKVLRYIADKNEFDALKLEGAKNYFVEGTCAAIVEVDERLQVTVDQIRWEEFFYDPRSRRKDFRDARYKGIAKWRYADEVAADHPKAKDDLENVMNAGLGAVDETFKDRPGDGTSSVAWVDDKKRRVMQVELYHQEGDRWYRCQYWAGGVLSYDVSPYLDENGRPCCPIEAQSCYIDRENNRHGVVRDMRPVQDEINKRRSKLLHLVTTSQVQASDANFATMEDADVVRREAARPDGVIPPGWEKVPTSDMAAGQAQLLAEAKSEIERLGPTPDILGRQSADSSGRAQLVRQQAGMTQFAVTFSGIEDWERRIYRQMWERARQYWQQPMWVRVTDEKGAPEFIGLNMPQADEYGQPMVDPNTGQPVAANRIAELDMDILLDSVPDTANVQQEQFQVLSELAKMYGPQEVPFDDLLKLSTIQGKRELLDQRKQRADQAQSGQQESPQAQLSIQGAMTELAKLQAEVDKLQAEADLTRAKTETELARPHIEAAKIMQTGEHHAMDLHHDAALTAAQMEQADQHHQTETAFRGAEMEQADNQFAGQMNSAERLAQMKAGNTPPPGA
jgi:hypothetical protein